MTGVSFANCTPVYNAGHRLSQFANSRFCLLPRLQASATSSNFFFWQHPHLAPNFIISHVVQCENCPQTQLLNTITIYLTYSLVYQHCGFTSGSEQNSARDLCAKWLGMRSGGMMGPCGFHHPVGKLRLFYTAEMVGVLSAVLRKL